MILELKIGAWRFVFIHIILKFFDIEPSVEFTNSDTDDVKIDIAEEVDPQFTNIELPLVDKRMKYLPSANKPAIIPPPAPPMRPPYEFKYTIEPSVNLANIDNEFSISDESAK